MRARVRVRSARVARICLTKHTIRLDVVSTLTRIVTRGRWVINSACIENTGKGNDRSFGGDSRLLLTAGNPILYPDPWLRDARRAFLFSLEPNHILRRPERRVRVFVPSILNFSTGWNHDDTSRSTVVRPNYAPCVHSRATNCGNAFRIEPEPTRRQTRPRS